MAEYIEREKVYDIFSAKQQALLKYHRYYQLNDADKEEFDLYDSYMDEVESIPSADVVEVVNGYNKTAMNPVDEFWCSVCGFCCADYTETKYDEDGDYQYSCECEFDYCPKCGAKMDGKGD